MKKIIILLVCAISPCFLWAQGGPYVGIKGTGGLSPIFNKNWWNMPELKYKAAFSWGVGPSIGYNAVYYNVGYTLGGFYKTYKQKFEINRGSNFDKKEKVSLQLNYLDVPVMLRFRPSGDEKTRQITMGGPYFEIGVQPSMILGVQHKHKDTTGQMIKDLITEKDDYEKYDVAAMLGFGFHQIGTKKWSVTHGLRLSYAFLDVVRGDKDILGVERINDGHYKWEPTRLINVSYVLTIYYKWPKME